MNPVGEFDSLYYELETFQSISKPTQYGIRVYADAQGISGDNNFFRWKFTGIYEINTFPELHGQVVNIIYCTRLPRLCAYENPCPCCKCWVTKNEDKPHLSNDQFVLNSKFKNIEVGYV
jgi:hypothetical protein